MTFSDVLKDPLAYSRQGNRHFPGRPLTPIAMFHKRVFPCAALLLVVGCSAPTSAHTRSASLYECSGGRTFAVTRDARAATVHYRDTRYELQRRTSSLGVRYSSPKASLIIDGDVAVFVTERILDLHVCSARPS